MIYFLLTLLQLRSGIAVIMAAFNSLGNDDGQPRLLPLRDGKPRLEVSCLMGTYLFDPGRPLVQACTSLRHARELCSVPPGLARLLALY